jgi:hypothetical protein
MHREFFEFCGSHFVVEYVTENGDSGPYPVDTEFFIMETRCHEVKLPGELCKPLDEYFANVVFPGLVASAEYDKKIERLEQCEGKY